MVGSLLGLDDVFLCFVGVEKGGVLLQPCEEPLVKQLGVDAVFDAAHLLVGLANHPFLQYMRILHAAGIGGEFLAVLLLLEASHAAFHELVHICRVNPQLLLEEGDEAVGGVHAHGITE